MSTSIDQLHNRFPDGLELRAKMNPVGSRMKEILNTSFNAFLKMSVSQVVFAELRHYTTGLINSLARNMSIYKCELTDNASENHYMKRK